MNHTRTQITKEKAREILQRAGLRATAPRLAVLQLLSKMNRPLSHTDVVKCLAGSDWDPATIYRNLVKLRKAGIAPVVSRVDGADLYAFSESQKDSHHHAHFSCEDCGQVACLPAAITSSIKMDGPWGVSIEKAMIELRGKCPECIAS